MGSMSLSRRMQFEKTCCALLLTGCLSRYRANAPVTKGAAILVPLFLSVAVEDASTAETIFTPGAYRSTHDPLSKVKSKKVL